MIRSKAFVTKENDDSNSYYASKTPGTHTIQTGWNRHVVMDLPARFTNHKCDDVTVGLKPNHLGAYDFVAMREIENGEEILWNYESTEYELAKIFSLSLWVIKLSKDFERFSIPPQRGPEVIRKGICGPVFVVVKEENLSDDSLLFLFLINWLGQ